MGGQPIVHPLRPRFRVAAVTGTDGKTTTTTMVDAILRADGRRVLRATTVGAFVDGEPVGGSLRSADFEAAIAEAAARGADHLALEVTSHALADGFARRFPPDVAALTTFSRDHLDHHKTAEHYLASKAQLFMALTPGGLAVLPTIEAGDLVAEMIGERRIERYAVEREATLVAADVTLDRSGVRARLRGPAAEVTALHLPLYSAVHVGNALAALLLTRGLGVSQALAIQALARFDGVPGRMQRVASAPLVFVDFAHTPNALAGTLRAARTLAGVGRVHIVFGCGGERDQGKRPEMGRIASELADHVVVTSDNPRRERAEDIAAAIELGMSGPAVRRRELDRAAAIERTIAEAAPADVVVIAGKGHETTQDIGGQLRPFSDLDAARSACQRHHPHAADRS
jgi:UDP-N-acetylmuramoyl-L-alanyl-D-glutamate--2,6-diaminopimelate ligase